MNIINGIASGGSPCALVSPSLSPEEGTLWERSTCKHGICQMYTNALCWGKNSGLKMNMSLHRPLNYLETFKKL